MSGAVHPDCQVFVAVVEELLERRRREAGGRGPTPAWRGPDWGPRAWTRTEFEDAVYASYKPMRQGRVTRPPRRETVMEIAGYLDCTLEERNRLLLAAGAAPVAPYLIGEPLREALQVGIGVAAALPLPAFIINRDWHIHYINRHALTLNGTTLEQLAAIPEPKLNILHLLFDPALPLYPYLSQNRVSWARMARQTIYGFKQANLLCQFEPWYQALLDQLMALPAFAEHWRSVQAAGGFEAGSEAGGPASVTVETALPGGAGRAWLRPLLISAGYFQYDFPQVVAFLPADPDSRDRMLALGIPAPETFAGPV